MVEKILGFLKNWRIEANLCITKPCTSPLTIRQTPNDSTFLSLGLNYHYHPHHHICHSKNALLVNVMISFNLVCVFFLTLCVYFWVGQDGIGKLRSSLILHSKFGPLRDVPHKSMTFWAKIHKSVLRPTPVMDKNHIGSSLPSPSGRRSTNHFHHCYSDLVSSAPPIGWGFMFPKGVLGHAKGRLSLTDCQKNPALIIIISQEHSVH